MMDEHIPKPGRRIPTRFVHFKSFLVLLMLGGILALVLYFVAMPPPYISPNISLTIEPSRDLAVEENEVFFPETADTRRPPITVRGFETGPRPESETDRPTLDQILERLDWGDIAFNTPESMYMEEVHVIELIVSMNLGPEELKQKLNDLGVVVTDRIRIANMMQVALRGTNFVITPVTPEVQLVSRQEATKWKWEIKPQDAGLNSLHLTVNALILMDGREHPRVIRTYDRRIDVMVTWSQRVAALPRQGWFWLLIAGGVGLGLWAGVSRRKARPGIASFREVKGRHVAEPCKQIQELKRRLSELADDLQSLENLLEFDIASSLNKIRFITEKCLHRMCKENGVTWGNAEPTLERMIGPLVSAGHIPKDIAIHVRTIQANSSPGSHYQESVLSRSHVNIAQSALIEFLNWYYANNLAMQEAGER